MAESDDDTAYPQPPLSADTLAPPTAPPKLYDAARNKSCGITSLEEVEAEYQGNQGALAARIQRDKTHRDEKTLAGLLELASDGVRLKALQMSLKGTKRSTETMVRMTRYTTPTSQQRIALGEFVPWAMPALLAMQQRAQVEVEPGKGVRDFVLPSLTIIVDIGRAAAKKAGCWGLPQVILITPAREAVEVVDLPKAIGWKEKRKPPFPYWEDRGSLRPPLDAYRLFLEVHEPGPAQDLRLAWHLDLFPLGEAGEPVTFHERGIVAWFEKGIFANAADLLGQLKPHVMFVAAQTAEDATATDADPTRPPLIPGDATGKQHATLDDIAATLSMPPGALAECLRSRGYLNLQGAATPAALDAGVTTIVEGGTCFCFDAIKQLLEEPKADGTEPMMVDKPDLGMIEVTPVDEPQDVATSAAPAPAGDETGTTRAGPATPVTVWPSGTGMKPISFGKQYPPTGDGIDADPISAAVPSGAVAVATLGNQAAKQLERAMHTLLTAQETMCRRTEGGFVAHSGDHQTLQHRMKAAAEAIEQVNAMLANLVPVWRTLEQVEVENAGLKRRVNELLTQPDDGDRESDARAEVIRFKPAGDPEDGAAAL